MFVIDNHKIPNKKIRTIDNVRGIERIGLPKSKRIQNEIQNYQDDSIFSDSLKS